MLGLISVAPQLPTEVFADGPVVFDPSGAVTTLGAASAIAADAGPYPSQIIVSGLSGNVSKMRVLVNDFQHVAPDDVDMLLVGPGGQTLVLWSDVGGLASTARAGVNATPDDAAASQLPARGRSKAATSSSSRQPTRTSLPPRAGAAATSTPTARTATSGRSSRSSRSGARA